MQVKALACELPHRKGLPLSRFSIADIRQEVLAQGLVAEISGATIWRWLSQDAIRPWRYRSWIFPRDPLFLEKAAPILDLYQGVWQGQPLGPQDFVLCADEKPSIQARRRKHPSLPPAPARRWPSIVPVHTPNHASWLNQVEIYFSIVQRKVLTPNDFHSLAQLEEALLAFQQRYEKSAAPFQWTFTSEDLAKLMIRLRAKALATAA